jgi:two-component system, LytTR family, sensor histidine kinase LytS
LLVAAMIERLGIIVTVAFVLTRIPFFRRLIDQEMKVKTSHSISLMILFGCFGIIGTYTGLIVNPLESTLTKWQWYLNEDEALANSRVIGIVAAGLLGGMRIGIGAGIIAGTHRFLLGGFTAVSCGISTILAGVIAGWISRYNKKSKLVSTSTGFAVGMLAETVQMLVILLVAKPYDQAHALVMEIGLPMILANGLGTGIFILIIRTVIQEEERMGAAQSQKALRIADRTVKYMRKGLSSESAQSTCEILMREVRVKGVSITNRTHILAHVGMASDHHFAHSSIQTEATKRVIETGELLVVGKESIQCDQANCPLGAAIIAPLKQGEKTVGTLKFYFQTEKEISTILIELVKGLSDILSHQLELAEIDHQKSLVKQAEIRALQAQISPHFLFNAMNTIVSLIRINPDKARKLLISLSNFIRQNLTGTTKAFSSLREELSHVEAYLTIEEARFHDRLSVQYEIDHKALSAQVPSITLQPLIENAIKHGLKTKEEGGILTIRINGEKSHVRVSIIDNGEGMEETVVNELAHQPVQSITGTGIGLYNINERLKKMMGEESAIHIQSIKGKGTNVTFTVPFTNEGDQDEDNHN